MPSLQYPMPFTVLAAIHPHVDLDILVLGFETVLDLLCNLY